MIPHKTLNIDGRYGEGGGQVLRTALSLSMITGQPFTIENIRGNRIKKGLLRQHLTAVNAAQLITNAKVQGNELGANTLCFVPNSIQGGHYHFDIKSAGSTTLVLQTILPALWFAAAPSTITVSGGTHNKAAPSAHFLMHTWLPLLDAMGIHQDLKLINHGFYPVGGGKINATTKTTTQIKPIDFIERGQLIGIHIKAFINNLVDKNMPQELLNITQHFPNAQIECNELNKYQGKGHVVMITTMFDHVNLSFAAFGDKNSSVSAVAQNAIQQVQSYLQSDAFADEYLADQLLLPFALAGSGHFTVEQTSRHFMTNIEIIQKFLPVSISTVQQKSCFLVSVTS